MNMKKTILTLVVVLGILAAGGLIGLFAVRKVHRPPELLRAAMSYHEAQP